jgi:ribonuclease D
LRDARKGDIADGILMAVAAGVSCSNDDLPQPDRSREKLQVNPALADLLRVLLKAKTESAGVAAKLIASAADLDAIAAGSRDVQAMRGWRLDVFGSDAQALCEGKIALTAVGNDVKVVKV